MAKEAALQVRIDADLKEQAKVDNMMFIAHDSLLSYYMEACIFFA